MSTWKPPTHTKISASNNSGKSYASSSSNWKGGGNPNKKPYVKKGVITDAITLTGNLIEFSGVHDIAVQDQTPGQAPKDGKITFKWNGRTFSGVLNEYSHSHWYKVASFKARKNTFNPDFQISPSSMETVTKALTVGLLVRIYAQFMEKKTADVEPLVKQALYEMVAEGMADKLFVDPEKMAREQNTMGPDLELKPAGLVPHWRFHEMMKSHPYFGSASVMKIVEGWLGADMAFAAKEDIAYLRRALMTDTWRCFFHGTLPTYIDPMNEVDIAKVENALSKKFPEEERRAIVAYHTIMEKQRWEGTLATSFTHLESLNVTASDVGWLVAHDIFTKVSMPNLKNHSYIEEHVMDSRIFLAEEKVCRTLRALSMATWEDDISLMLSKLLVEMRPANLSQEQIVALSKMLQTKLHLLNGGPGTGKTHLGAMIFAHIVAVFRGLPVVVATLSAQMKNKHNKKYKEALPMLYALCDQLAKAQPGFPPFARPTGEGIMDYENEGDDMDVNDEEADDEFDHLFDENDDDEDDAEEFGGKANQGVVGLAQSIINRAKDALEDQPRTGLFKDLPPISAAEQEFIDSWLIPLKTSSLFAPPKEDLEALTDESVRQWVRAWGSPLTSTTLLRPLERRLGTPLEQLMAKVENGTAGKVLKRHIGASANSGQQNIDPWLRQELVKKVGPVFDLANNKPVAACPPRVKFMNFAEIMYAFRKSGKPLEVGILIIDEQMLTLVDLASLLDSITPPKGLYLLGDFRQLGPGNGVFQVITDAMLPMPMFGKTPQLADLALSTIMSRLLTNFRIKPQAPSTARDEPEMAGDDDDNDDGVGYLSKKLPSRKKVNAIPLNPKDLVCGKTRAGEIVELRDLAKAIEDIGERAIPQITEEFDCICPSGRAFNEIINNNSPHPADLQTLKETVLDLAFDVYQADKRTNFIACYADERDALNAHFYKCIKPELFHKFGGDPAKDKLSYILGRLPLFKGEKVRIARNTITMGMQVSNGDGGEITHLFTKSPPLPKADRNIKYFNGLPCTLIPRDFIQYFEYKNSIAIINNELILDLSDFSSSAITPGFCNTLASLQGSQDYVYALTSLQHPTEMTSFTDNASLYTSASRPMEKFTAVFPSPRTLEHFVMTPGKKPMATRLIKLSGLTEEHFTGRLPFFDWMLERIGLDWKASEKKYQEILAALPSRAAKPAAAAAVKPVAKATAVPRLVKDTSPVSTVAPITTPVMTPKPKTVAPFKGIVPKRPTPSFVKPLPVPTVAAAANKPMALNMTSMKSFGKVAAPKMTAVSYDSDPE